MIADPGERQIGERDVVLVEMVERHGVGAAAIERSLVSTTPFETPVVPDV